MNNIKNSETYTSWLTEHQACIYLGISRTTLYRLRLKEAISYSQYGRLIRYRKEDLDAFLMHNYVQTIHPP
ncbi:MAG: helix-turn-helix domain-containing protein [Saprospiraceae bacterium]|nr:helix-turn-helix domain-containing protein [Saprospiraceae bacterium]